MREKNEGIEEVVMKALERKEVVISEAEAGKWIIRTGLK